MKGDIDPAYRPALAALGLDTIDGAKSFRANPVFEHGRRRDVQWVNAPGPRPVRLFVKRAWRPYLKHGIASLLRRGRVWSVAREEYERLCAAIAAGVPACLPVAYGEDCGLFRERFSFLVTEAAPGIDLCEFLATCAQRHRRRLVLKRLGEFVRALHDRGVTFPDLFSRHVFVDVRGDGEAADTADAADVAFTLIDVARLDFGWRRASGRRRARDLAALNASVPLRDADARDRVAVLRAYCRGRADRRLFRLIARRMARLLKRRRLRGFADASADSTSARPPHATASRID